MKRVNQDHARSKNNKKKFNLRLEHLLKKKEFFVPPIIALLIILSLNSYIFYFKDKSYPGVKIASLNLGKLGKKDVQTSLAQNFELRKNLGFSFSNREKLSFEELGISYDLSASVKEVFEVGRRKNAFQSLKEIFLSLFGKIDLKPTLVIDENKFNQTIETLTKELIKPAVEASVNLEDGKISIKKAQEGIEIDKKVLRNQIISSLENLEDKEINLVTQIAKPKVTTEAANQAKGEVEKFISQEVSLNFQNRSWTIKREEIARLIVFENTSSNTLKITLSEKGFSSFIKNIAKEVNQEAVNGRFEINNDRVTNFTLSQEGREVDEKETLNNLDKALRNEEKKAQLAVKIIQPQVDSNSGKDLDIRDLLAKGESKFAGRDNASIHNLSFASEKLHGVLIAPGETFSMYKVLGDVETYTGYKEAMVILEGKLQLGAGGGVCQVSTTLYRAILNAGLPIVERYPHAFRVGYYEQGFPPGLDASVYFPYSDFKFKNDTNDYILIQRKLDLKNAYLAFEIYGINDGRIVEISKPKILNQTKPPEAKYVDDANLPKGTKKQIQWEVWGADVEFERKIYKNSKLVTDEKVLSEYQTWKAIFLVGTKEETPLAEASPLTP